MRDPERKRALAPGRDQFRDRFAVASDDHGLAFFHQLEQAGDLAFRLVHVDLHEFRLVHNLAKSTPNDFNFEFGMPFAYVEAVAGQVVPEQNSQAAQPSYRVVPGDMRVIPEKRKILKQIDHKNHPGYDIPLCSTTRFMVALSGPGCFT